MVQTADFWESDNVPEFRRLAPVAVLAHPCPVTNAFSTDDRSRRLWKMRRPHVLRKFGIYGGHKQDATSQADRVTKSVPEKAWRTGDAALLTAGE